LNRAARDLIIDQDETLFAESTFFSYARKAQRDRCCKSRRKTPWRRGNVVIASAYRTGDPRFSSRPPTEHNDPGTESHQGSRVRIPLRSPGSNPTKDPGFESHQGSRVRIPPWYKVCR
jgi:hypothetical protein